jgi:hypothetical protein
VFVRPLVAAFGVFGTSVCCGMEFDAGVAADGVGEGCAAGGGAEGCGDVAAWRTGARAPGGDEELAVFCGGADGFCALLADCELPAGCEPCACEPCAAEP